MNKYTNHWQSILIRAIPPNYTKINSQQLKELKIIYKDLFEFFLSYKLKVINIINIETIKKPPLKYPAPLKNTCTNTNGNKKILSLKVYLL